MWYPLKKEELEETLSKFLKEGLIKRHKAKPVNGIIVPHAGYIYSGAVAAKAFPYIKGAKKAIILAPNHYFPLNGIVTHNDKEWQTPLGKIKIIKSDFRKANLTQEHAIDNQIPFLQKIKVKEILPLVVGEISSEDAKIYAAQLSEYKDYAFIISTDLSHFLTYDDAIARDKKTINIIENLDTESIDKIDACGIYPLMILLHLCKIMGWQPKLLEYKNSGDVTQDKERVVGYATMTF